MDQRKVGGFLKVLRREKGLTQEQLAEHLRVSARTVSRWETGNNMPDLSLLVELADFYKVDIREIINGERKSETMNDELQDTLKQVAAYGEQDKAQILNRIQVINILGLLMGLGSMLLNFMDLPRQALFFEILTNCMIGFAAGAILATLLYINGILERISGNPKRQKAWKAIGVAGFVLVAVCLLAAAVYSFVK